jgi:hypothetical protein
LLAIFASIKRRKFIKNGSRFWKFFAKLAASAFCEPFRSIFLR